MHFVTRIVHFLHNIETNWLVEGSWYLPLLLTPFPFIPWPVETSEAAGPSPTIIALPKSFPCRYGVPVLSAVDAAVFTARYFTHCMQCTFCHDSCCQHGVDVDMLHVPAIEAHAPELEARMGIPRDRWFTGEYTPDPEMPGGGSLRTQVVDGACVFRDRSGRGCHVHAYCLERGIDYHTLKPIIDCLFPLTFSEGVLYPAIEVDDRSLICLDTGPTLYRGVRDELRYYFGEELLLALDAIEATL